MSAVQLDRIKELWRQLQCTRPTSARYQELVALIRAETCAHLTPPVLDHTRRPKA
jgi:hypothetical protein